MPTPLLPTLNKLVEDEWENLRRKQLTPWAFLTAGPPFRCTDFFGKEIRYQGIRFEGSPRERFWGGYIEPFLKDSTHRLTDQVVKLCADKGQDSKVALRELAKLLNSMIRQTYNDMAEIDQRLRGNGNPFSVPRRSVRLEIDLMQRYVDERIEAELAIARQGTIVKWFKRHSYLSWLIPSIIGLLTLVIQLL